MSAPDSVVLAGIGSTRFGKHLDRSIADLTQAAIMDALVDAGVEIPDVDCIIFANAAEGVMTGQEMIRGQVALSGSELAGPAVINVENACASGSTAVHLAALLVRSGQYGCVVVAGAEKLFHADKSRSFAAIEAGVDQGLDLSTVDAAGSVMMGCYAAEARAYQAAHGPVQEAMAAVAVKNRGFAATNPNAQYQAEVDASVVLNSRIVADPLRMLMCAPMTDGAAAVVVRSHDAAERLGRSVRIVDTRIAAYRPRTSVVSRAATAIYEATGITPHEVDVWQLHDACAFAELAQYEQVGIAQVGGGARAVLDGVTGLSGPSPVNTDGGLLSRGHPLGATGVSQLVELTRQLRGERGDAQVDSAELAMSVNGGGWMGDDYAVSVTTLLSRT